MIYMLGVVLLLFLVSIVVLDITKKVSIINRYFMGIFLLLTPHIVLLFYIFSKFSIVGKSEYIGKWLLLFEVVIFLLYILLKINIFPNTKKQIVNMRLRMLVGGRTLVLYGLYTALVQIFIYTIGLKLINGLNIDKSIFITDFIVMALIIVLLIFNGMVRILLTSRRMVILKRGLVAFWSFIPIVNIFVMLYACHIAKMEYDHECYKVINREARVDSEICKTKYPLVLVHGVGFRDLKYINYWGRIPKELIRNGAIIYYGNQEAWGTIKYNANDIKNKVLEVLRETGCDKVNIIAHSKGGLDSRYMISKLDMGKYVASLTTMSTPHRGSKVIDVACHIPDGIYKSVAKFVNRCFRKVGDKNPDFYNASRQFSTAFSKEFNGDVKDVEDIYYQSYTSVMKNMFSDFILSIAFPIVKAAEGENDGLVCIESAKWGEFKGVLRNNRRRGISHGDIIDLRRDDYKGFDVVEKYVEIVSDLKNRGY